MIRVLVTGSRDWVDRDRISNAFQTYQLQLESLGLDPAEVVLVSGACPTGADRMAEEIAAQLFWEVELHPADWDRYGKRAGFLRNKEMVDSGVEVCFAFVRNHSRGASMTVDLCRKAGVPLNLFEE